MLSSEEIFAFSVFMECIITTVLTNLLCMWYKQRQPKNNQPSTGNIEPFEFQSCSVKRKKIKTLRYVETDKKKKRKIQNRQTSKTVTLPKPWWKKLGWSQQQVDIRLLKNPETNDVLGVLIEVRKEEKEQ